MIYGLNDKDVHKINEVMACYPEVEKVMLYGSRAKGNYTACSDIDLTLAGKEINLTLLNEITSKLDDLLLPYMIDASIFSHINNSDLIDHINRVGKVLYKKEVPILQQEYHGNLPSN
jgi:predicted nucleotidyltransferase